MEFKHRNIKYTVTIHGENGIYAPSVTINGSDIGKSHSAKFEDFPAYYTEKTALEAGEKRAQDIIDEWIEDNDK